MAYNLSVPNSELGGAEYVILQVICTVLSSHMARTGLICLCSGAIVSHHQLVTARASMQCLQCSSSMCHVSCAGPHKRQEAAHIDPSLLPQGHHARETAPLSSTNQTASMERIRDSMPAASVSADIAETRLAF